MLFIKNENNPRVMILNGRVTMLKIGFTTAKRMDSAIPPMTYVINPPLTLSPSNI